MFDYFYGAQAEQFAFYRVPKVLFTNDRFKYLSAEAKTLYGILLDRVPLSAKNGWIDEQGRVHIICTIEEIMADMNCGNKKAIQLLSDLEEKVGLIERKRQGLGKPNLIYVKNFISADSPVERHFLKCQNDTYNVVYLYGDEATGKRKQKWESFKTMADAKRRKAEIEYRQEIGTMVLHQCKTVDELLKEYVALYGKTTWSMSVYGSNTALIEHYISPIIGSMKLSDVTARVLEKYYMQLLKTPSVHRITQKANSKNVIYVAPLTVRKIHNILRSAFHQAVKWELMVCGNYAQRICFVNRLF